MTTTKAKVIMDEAEIARAVTRIAHQIVETNKGVQDLVLVGVIARGVPLAKRLAKIIGKTEKSK